MTQQLGAMMDPQGMDELPLARLVMARAGDPTTGLHGYGTCPVAERTWMVQLVPTNVGVFETDEGLVLVDTGCPGDAVTLREAVRELSPAPLHTVVYTHGHLDHAFGLGRLLADGEKPRIIAHENTPARFERYLRCHVAEWAMLADPDDAEARRVAAQVFTKRANGEPSSMARGIYRTLARRASQ